MTKYLTGWPRLGNRAPVPLEKLQINATRGSLLHTTSFKFLNLSAVDIQWFMIVVKIFVAFIYLHNIFSIGT